MPSVINDDCSPKKLQPVSPPDVEHASGPRTTTAPEKCRIDLVSAGNAGGSGSTRNTSDSGNVDNDGVKSAVDSDKSSQKGSCDKLCCQNEKSSGLSLKRSRLDFEEVDGMGNERALPEIGVSRRVKARRDAEYTRDGRDGFTSPFKFSRDQLWCALQDYRARKVREELAEQSI